MQDMRYAPPATVELQVQREPSWVSGPLPRRPMAIWVMAVVQLLVVTGMAMGMVRGFVLAQSGAVSLGALLVRILIVGFFVAALGAAMFGLWRRRRWSRWVGLVLVILLGLWRTFGPDTTSYSNEAELAGGFFGARVLAPLLCVWWGYALAFSDKARRYFGLLQDQ